MGCNYYLKKKTAEKWILPINNLGRVLTKICVEERKDGRRDISINLLNCTQEEELLHIGKSSSGWHFSLCIYPFMNIYNLTDWEKLFSDSNYIILNENNEEITKDEMLEIITKRSVDGYNYYNSQEDFELAQIKNHNSIEEKLWQNFSPVNSYDELLAQNHASRGKNGLWSHCSLIVDFREREEWDGYMPLISIYIPTSGTYDLTENWDFS